MPDAEGRYVAAIVGSRDFWPDDDVYKVIERLRARHPEGVAVVTGDAKGVDTVAWQAAAMLGLPYVIEEAHWPPAGAPSHEKAAAGTERNTRVVARADTLIAFFHPGPASDLPMTSSGTVNAFRQATSRGIPVYAFHEGKWYSHLPGATPVPEGWVVPPGYTADDRLSRCGSRVRPGCGAEIRWSTTPKGRKSPLNADGTSHFATCPEAARFRGGKDAEDRAPRGR